MSGGLDKLSYIDPEQLAMYQNLLKSEREAAEKQLKQAFKGMKFVPNRIQEKLIGVILATDSFKRVPSKEKNIIRNKIARILKFIQSYEMQDGKNIMELEAKLDEVCQQALILYKRDHRDNVIGGAGKIDFGGSDLGSDGPGFAEQASLTDELQRGNYQKEMKNIKREMELIRQDNERLMRELESEKRKSKGTDPTFTDDPGE